MDPPEGGNHATEILFIETGFYSIGNDVIVADPHSAGLVIRLIPN
jgi:hypothetical protein